MLSLDPTTEKDPSFVPPSSTSTSTPTTEEEEANCRFKDKKWIVNESSLMELFTRCHHCGASVTETKKQLVEASYVLLGNVQMVIKENGTHVMKSEKCQLTTFLRLHVLCSTGQHI